MEAWSNKNEFASVAIASLLPIAVAMFKEILDGFQNPVAENLFPPGFEVRGFERGYLIHVVAAILHGLLFFFLMRTVYHQFHLSPVQIVKLRTTGLFCLGFHRS